MLPYISTDRFTYNKDTKTFIAEASELPTPMLGQVWPDSLDQGFVLVSRATGHEATFTIWEEEKNSEGELEAYRLLPTPEAVKKNPGLKGVQVLVFND